MAFGLSVDGWEPEQAQLIGMALACPFSPRPLDAREFLVFCLNANTAFLCKSRGSAMSNEIPDTITIRTRIISRLRKMSAMCSFPGVLAFAFADQKRLARIEKPMQADHCVALDHCSDSFGLSTMACVALPGLDDDQLLRRDLLGRLAINVQVCLQHFAGDSP